MLEMGIANHRSRRKRRRTVKEHKKERKVRILLAQDRGTWKKCTRSNISNNLKVSFASQRKGISVDEKCSVVQSLLSKAASQCAREARCAESVVTKRE